MMATPVLKHVFSAFMYKFISLSEAREQVKKKFLI